MLRVRQARGVSSPDSITTISSSQRLADELLALGRTAGLDAVGITTAEILEPARSVLQPRKDRGLAATMNFTYRNPVRSTDPSRTLAGASSIIAGAMGYQRQVPTAPAGVAGRVARYSWRDHYADLRDALEVIAGSLREAGYRARVHCDDNALVDRNVAYRAGLGWYGKNANLLIPGSGSWFVLGSVVTDAVLPVNKNPEADQCGSCQRCFEGCPTDAIVGPGVIDARRCLAWLVQAEGPIPLEFREALGDRLYGCDVCQDVCPPNRKTETTSSASTLDEAEDDSDPWLPLLWLLRADDEALMARVGRWYIAKRDPAVVRRTALVNLGNIADPCEEEVREVLGQYLRDENALLRAHAVWACKRLGLVSLLDCLTNEDDPIVIEELRVSVQTRFGPN